MKKVTADFEALGFNTAIAQMMVFVNEVYRNGTCPREYAEGFIKMMSCITPHVGEEMWQILGHENTIAYESWPTYDEAKCKDTTVTMAVQVNGKMRGTVEMEADLPNEEVVARVVADEKIARFLEKQWISEKAKGNHQYMITENVSGVFAARRCVRRKQ